MNTRIKYCAAGVIGMSTKIENIISTTNFRYGWLGIIAICISGVTLAAPEPGDSGSDEKPRTSISIHHVRGGRDNPTDVRETTEDYAGLVETGARSKSVKTGGLVKFGTGDSVSQSPGADFWFYEADVILFNDDDNDGYYYGIDLLFDADTNFVSADVYAVLYLSFEGGPWNEYAVTEDFTILGASGTDEYVLVTELMSGYPTGNYDLLIELFDAYDSAYLASIGPGESSALSYMPLEDYDHDVPVRVVHVVEQGSGGGAIDSWLLSALVLLLLIGAVRKIWRRRNDVLVRIDSRRSPTSSQPVGVD